MNLEFTKVIKNKNIDYMQNYLDAKGSMDSFFYGMSIEDFSDIFLPHHTSKTTSMQ
jgi:hypothetical protein